MELTPSAVSQEWKSHKFRPAYLFLGEDDAARQQAFAELKAAIDADPFNLCEFSTEPVEDIVSAVSTLPMFADRRLVLVKNPRLGAAAKKAFAEYLKDPNAAAILALESEDKRPDSRDALTSAVAAKGAVVVFQPLREDEAARRLVAEAEKAGVALDEEAAELVVEEAGTNWGILRSELAKMLLFAKGRKTLGREEALACLGYRRDANPFDLPRLVLARDRAGALKNVRRLLEEGADEFQLLAQVRAAVNRLFKAKRLAAAGRPQAQIFGELRLHPHFDRDFLKLAAQTNEAKLVRGLKACLDVEVSLKSKAWLDGQVELERLIAYLCS